MGSSEAEKKIQNKLTDKEAKERAYLRRMKAKQEKEEKEAVVRLEQQRTKEAEDARFMKEALRQAKKAAKLSEVPIGCVLVKDGQIVARGYNRRNTDKTTLAHAEMAVIKKASKLFADWRLEDCTLYVTLEPCPMCAGAIVQARIPRVVAGCMNPKAGCAGSVLNILNTPGLNHQVKFEKGVLEEECSELLQNFFRELRRNGKKIEK
ncbi:MAG: tRNA adenosine(34) deaminase TadA [Lachnospiraceae bacterium]|nr:tRNA adenosine(34) deaminase TadA [Lachnospiraceae bacterium]